MRTAAIGIGSNSLRMLIADIQDARLVRVLRDREGLRVFAALDEQGNISGEMIARACDSVGKMAKKARESGCETVHLFATSAVRDAKNQAEFSEALWRATGLRVEVCPGDEEARLSFMGATGAARSGMIDIGGGSTEIVIGQGPKLDYLDSLQMGAVRLFRQQPITSVETAYQVVRIAASILGPQRAAILAVEKPAVWVGVGGTFTTTAALVQNIPWTNRERVHGFMATQGHIRRVMEDLAPMTVGERLLLPGLQPQRADIVVHGLAILIACMEQLEIPEITVSEYGNLEGYLKRRYLSA